MDVYIDHTDHTHGAQTAADQEFCMWLRERANRPCPECRQPKGMPHTKGCDRCGVVGSTGSDNPDRSIHPSW